MEEKYLEYIKNTPVIFNTSYDCEEIAEDLCKIFGGQAQVYKAYINEVKYFKVKEFDTVKDFTHHYFVVVDGYVLDPRFSSNPIKFDKYVEELYSLNPTVRDELKIELQLDFGPSDTKVLGNESIIDIDPLR